ncbi:SDR family NAD(P)-dependent oxidoreductase [Steroidobacter flavus]|uniref:SDR family NAD(P)-dependent oxidoreductase n=1 Tax=Steroidobacter flavus TaxID=1842136 RepID=A0ABV8SVM4_9GAMM
METLSDEKSVPERRQKAVLVTGAGSGIGRCITEHLVADGHLVFAGARKKADLRDLERMNNVQPLRLDVTSPNDIESALSYVENSGRGLYGLVNNAGVGALGPIVGGDDREFELVMTVNLFGPYRITKAFAPLVIAERGRIVTIGSISGILAAEGAGAYSMSKHAMEAFTDSLSLELEVLGVLVSVVEPGKFRSAIARSALTRIGASDTPVDLSTCREPHAVAEAVVDALFGRIPKRRYLVAEEQEAQRTIRKQIEQLVQLNEGHSHTYERDALIAMLDEALLRSRPRVEPAAMRDLSSPSMVASDL